MLKPKWYLGVLLSGLPVTLKNGVITLWFARCFWKIAQKCIFIHVAVLLSRLCCGYSSSFYSLCNQSLQGLCFALLCARGSQQCWVWTFHPMIEHAGRRLLRCFCKKLSRSHSYCLMLNFLPSFCWKMTNSELFCFEMFLKHCLNGWFSPVIEVLSIWFILSLCAVCS